MRTFEEIKIDIDLATNINDAEALLRCATELDALGTPKAEAAASSSRGSALLLRGDYSAALSCLHDSLALFEDLGDHIGVASTTDKIGTVHSRVGDHSAALEHYHRARALYEEYGDRAGMTVTTGHIGIVHHNTGDYPTALSHYHRALALYEELGNRYGVASITGNIGNVHQNTGDYSAALENHHRALVLHEELGNRNSVAICTGNIGIVYRNTGDYTAALEYYHRALELHEELGDRSGMARVIMNIGTVHGSTGDHHAALKYFQHAQALHEDVGERSGMALAMVNILAVHLNMESNIEAQTLLQAMDDMHIDDLVVRISRELLRAILQERSGNLDGAVETLQHTQSEAQVHGLRAKEADAHKALRDLALKQSNLAAYVEHNNEYTRITEEINGKETTLKLAMQAKQREIDAERKEHEKHMAVLHSTLPKHIADRVARGEVVNDHHENATVLFLDIVGFTSISDRIPSGHVVHLLEQIFTTLDAVCERHNIVKIKTIGDSYMAVSFPGKSLNSEQRAANAAIDMLIAISHLHPVLSEGLLANVLEDLPEGLQVRLGLHCGPVTAGVIGTARMQYDVWGDTVNVASRMESTSEPGRIHVSEAFASALQTSPPSPLSSVRGGTNSPFHIPHYLRERGALEIKGKGTMTTYWLESTTT